MSELTAKENIKTADAVKRITATAVMAALTTLMTAYIFHIPVCLLYTSLSGNRTGDHPGCDSCNRWSCCSGCTSDP